MIILFVFIFIFSFSFGDGVYRTSSILFAGGIGWVYRTSSILFCWWDREFYMGYGCNRDARCAGVGEGEGVYILFLVFFFLRVC